MGQQGPHLLNYPGDIYLVLSLKTQGLTGILNPALQRPLVGLLKYASVETILTNYPGTLQ